MKILLIIPPGGYYAERWSGGVLMPPLGIGYVAASLENTPHDVRLLDAHVGRMTDRDVQMVVENEKPDVVGLTFTTENRFEAFATARAIREAAPGCHLTAGGPHVSLAATDTLEGVSVFDSVVAGEGEITMVELVEALSTGREQDLGKIGGLVYRDSDGAIRSNPVRDRIMDLDSIPFPARHLYPPMSDYHFQFEVPGKGIRQFSNLMTSRGCPCACNFCATPKVWGRQVRMRSPENIMSEIDLMVERHGAQALWFFDDTFNSSPNRVRKLCAMIRDRKYDLPWFCEVRVDQMSKDLLADMRDAGCYTIGFGVESGSQRILDDVVGKHLKLEKVHELYGWCRELDVIANPFFILSHPTETWEEARMTIDLIRKFRESAQVSMAFMHVYPGTDLEREARRIGTLPSDFKWHQEGRTDVKTLPSAQGNVPIFLDRLSWSQVSDLLFEWAEMQHYSVWRKIPKVLRSIRSMDDVKRYGVMGWRYLRRRLSR